MRTLRILPVFATLAVASSALASEPNTLNPGSPAPDLSIKKWLKGTPVTNLERGKTYVVEFWATWCGPCIQSIPHVTELAKANPDVTFIGVGIWEDEVDDNLKKFVDKMGDKMGYNVAYSGNQDGMAETWMKPFARNGIPSAFIVKDQKVLWAGHPMSMDKPLAEIKAGTFDLEGFKAKYEIEANKTRAQMAMNDDLTAATKMFDEGKRAEAKAAMAKVGGKYPDAKGIIEQIQFGWLAEEDPAAWEVQAKALIDSKDPRKISQLSSFAYSKAQKPEGYDLARKAIAMALKGTESKDFNVLLYAMNVYKKTGDTQLALDATNKLLEMYPNSPAKDSPEFKESLEKAKKEFEEKLAKG